MKTIILPGYSLHNRQWAYEVKEYLEKNGLTADVYEWKHWQGGRMNMRQEVENLIEFAGSEKINVIAKSIGTKVFMKLFSTVENQIQKVILCGIPDPAGYAKGIKKMGQARLLIFQNSKDPFMPYSAISAYVKLVDKDVRVIKKESSTHEYPYYGEFTDFLAI